MIFPALLLLAAFVALVGTLVALDGSKDAFHPLVFTGPIMMFLYGWMPWKLWMNDGLQRFFDQQQMIFVAALNVMGVLAFVGGCLAMGVRTATPGTRVVLRPPSPRMLRRLLLGGALAGAIGLGCWLITIINVGGIVKAYSSSYSGGWDDSGYVRDGSILLLLGVMTAVISLSSKGPRFLSYGMLLVFGLPWLTAAIFMARRGPTFELTIVTLMSWYIFRKKRPPIVALGVVGVCLGWLVLFLVTNRGSIYLGSSFDVKSDVSEIVQSSDTGNEWIYGAGTILSAERRNHYFWLRRYLAQVLVRPIPSAIWPNKYADFGVPELLHNAGTGEGFGDALGWRGADGSAPGIVADLWVEAWYGAIPLMAILGAGYGFVWRRAVLRGGGWTCQYIILAALSIYLVMQTMEAVIFRSLLLSIPSWLIWRYALKTPLARRQAMRKAKIVSRYARPLRIQES